MKYFRVVKEKYDHSTGYTTTMNELVTPRERNIMFRNLGDDCFEEVEISKKNTYMNFGVRFEIGTGHYGKRKDL